MDEEEKKEMAELIDTFRVVAQTYFAIGVLFLISLISITMVFFNYAPIFNWALMAFIYGGFFCIAFVLIFLSIQIKNIIREKYSDFIELPEFEQEDE